MYCNRDYLRVCLFFSFFGLGLTVPVVVMSRSPVPTPGADQESHKGTLNVILEGQYYKKKKSES